MHAWEAIQETVDYIEEHLEEELQVEVLAQQVHLSPFYFQRLFTRLVGRPVMEYAKMRRLAKASEALLKTDQRILDIAFAYGFSSHEAFTKAFKSTYHLTPEDYRRKRVSLNHIIKPELLLNYTLVEEGFPLITAGMFLEINYQQLLIEEHYLGWIGKIPLGSHIPAGEATGISAIAPLWEKFRAAKADHPALLPEGIELGVSFVDEKTDPLLLNGADFFNYFAGGESNGSFSSDLAEWRLKPGEYLVCSFEAESAEKLVSEALDKALHYLFDTWLPAHQMATEPFSIEKYYPAQIGSNYMEIWLIPLKIEN